MMNNIFSMFDPYSSKLMSLNWISIFSCLMFTPLMFFNNNSRSLNMMWFYLNFMNQNMKSNLHKKNFKVIIIMIMICLIITSMNILSLMPYYFTPTAHISITLMLSLPMWLSLNMKNWLNSPNYMFSHLVPNNTPMFLCPFMVIIETISNMLRPLTLSVRLSANMVAGHVLISLLSQTLSMSIMISQNMFMLLILLMLLEISVAFIQGYVFIILLSLYINEI